MQGLHLLHGLFAAMLVYMLVHLAQPLVGKSFAGQRGTVFQWHGETFSIPPGATRLFANMHCANQMFALGPHLGMQCHVEMTPEMIATWCGQWADEAIAVADQSSVQMPEAMQKEIAERLPVMVHCHAGVGRASLTASAYQCRRSAAGGYGSARWAESPPGSVAR